MSKHEEMLIALRQEISKLEIAGKIKTNEALSMVENLQAIELIITQAKEL